MKSDVWDISIHNNYRIKYLSWPETDLNLHYFLSVYAAFLRLKGTGALSLQSEQKMEYCPQSEHLFGLLLEHTLWPSGYFLTWSRELHKRGREDV